MPLTKNEIKALLSERRLAHLATVGRSGKPHVSPIWIEFEDGEFYFTTRLSRVKGRDMQRNPYAAISIATDERPYKAVLAVGKAELVKEKRDEWLRRISTKYGEAEGLRWLAHALKESDRVVMRLKPERLLSWDYGRGDARRQDQGESMSTE